MHIPDGFISPKIYIPAYIVASGLWIYSFNRIRSRLDEKTIPLLSVLTAFAFILMTLMIPLPGGSSAHPSGVALLSIIFGYYLSFISLSVVFFIQAVILGEGGITTFPINAVVIGFLGSLTAYYTYKTLKNINENIALFISGWLSVNVSAFFIAIILGIQPIIAHTPEGKPLFFPFGLDITIPAVMIPHLFIGIADGIITVLGYKLLRKLRDDL
ncbi:energy-coupling factor ABC transporter permease [Persephonella sp.]